jgi:hypothetical protein
VSTAATASDASAQEVGPEVSTAATASDASAQEVGPEVSTGNSGGDPEVVKSHDERAPAPTENADSAPPSAPLSELPEQLLARAFSFLEPADLANVRLLSRGMLKTGSTAMRSYFQRCYVEQGKMQPDGTTGRTYFTAVSSSAAGFLATLSQAVKDRAPDQLTVVADQVNPQTALQLTAGVVGRAIVYSGAGHDHGPRQSRAKGGRTTFARPLPGPTSDASSKMHLKSVIGSKGSKPAFLMSGSPNITRSAMEKNTESVAIMDFPGIARLYQEYVDLVKSGKTARSPEGQDFGTRLAEYNERNPTGVRAALAPFVNIGDQLTLELQGADRIVMRMFLVSNATTSAGADPIGALVDLREAGANVSVVVDQGQASQRYVRAALARLQAGGVDVAEEGGKPATPGEQPGIMHDKVVLAHYPQTDTAQERWTVMIGSSGLTRNVMQDLNYENLLIIDDKKLFDELEVHHRAQSANRHTPPVPECPRCRVRAALRRDRHGDYWGCPSGKHRWWQGL